MGKSTIMGDHALFSIASLTLGNPILWMVAVAYITVKKKEIAIEKSA